MKNIFERFQTLFSQAHSFSLSLGYVYVYICIYMYTHETCVLHVGVLLRMIFKSICQRFKIVGFNKVRNLVC